MKYKQKADLILTLVFATFVITSFLKTRIHWNIALEMFRFMLESALIGGIADWFAVTALFKKPLGWPFHTALIARNRERLIDSLSVLVQDELLNLGLLTKIIRQTDFLEQLLTLLNRSDIEFYKTSISFQLRNFFAENAFTLRNKLNSYLEHSTDNIGKSLAHYIYEKAKSPDWLLELAHGYLSQPSPGLRQAIFDFLADAKEKQIDQSRFKKLISKALEDSNIVDLNEATDAIYGSLISNLKHISSSTSPNHNPVQELYLIVFNEILLNEQIVQTSIEKWLVKNLKDPSIKENLIETLDYLIKFLVEKPGVLEDLMDYLIERIKIILRENNELYANLNIFIQTSITYLLEKKHPLIGEIVREIFTNLSDDDLNSFVESKAGNDLQWVRINGSFVGAIIGFFIFTFLNFLFEPYIYPLIKLF